MSANLKSQDQEEQQADSSPNRQEQDSGERNINPDDQLRSEAVDQVDQNDLPQSEEGLSETGEGKDESGRLSGKNPLMEQWLDQVEGDPTQLMQQQFKLEEYKYLRSRGGRDRETRPW